MIKNRIFSTGQVITLATGQTYTLKDDEVLINNTILKKRDLEISLFNIGSSSDQNKVSVGIRKRDGLRALPAHEVRYDEWQIDGVTPANLGACIEAINTAIYWNEGGSGGGGGATYRLLDNRPSPNNFQLTEDGTPVSTIDMSVYQQVGDDFLGNQIVIGGYIHLTGLQYYFWADLYYINGVRYDTPINATLTLSASDPTNDRIDVPVITAPNTIEIVEGVAMANPAEPDIDEETQVAYPFIIVEAGTSAPTGITNELVYDENAGEPSEWTAVASDGAINVGSTNDPQSGTISIHYNNAPFRSRVDFTNDVELNGGVLSALIFRVKLISAPANHRLWVRLYNTTGADGIGVTINNGQFGYDTSQIGVWQTIVVPSTVLGVSTRFYDQVRIANWRGGASEFYIDNVVLQSGVNYENVIDTLYSADGAIFEPRQVVMADGNPLEFIGKVNETTVRIEDANKRTVFKHNVSLGNNTIDSASDNIFAVVAESPENAVNVITNSDASSVVGDSHVVSNSFYVAVNGYGNTVTGNYSGLVSGTQNTTDNFYQNTLGRWAECQTAYYTTAIGVGVVASRVGMTAVGTANTIQPPSNSVNNNASVVFAVGNGTIVTAGGVNNADVRSDAFLAYHSGLLTAPSLTTALIDGEATGKVLITREWFSANAGNTIYSADDTINSARTVTIADEQSLAFTGTVNSGVVISTGAFTVNANGGTITLATNSLNNQISMPEFGNMAIIAQGTGLRLTLPTNPTTGQGLLALNGNGDLGWGDVGGALVSIDEGNGFGYHLVLNDRTNTDNIGGNSLDLGYYANSGFLRSVTINDAGDFTGTPDGTYFGGVASTSGSGTGGRFVVTIAGGIVTAINDLEEIGNNYAVSDTITLSLNGVTQVSPCIVDVATVAGGGASIGGSTVIGGDNICRVSGSNFGQHLAVGYANWAEGYYNNMAFGVYNRVYNGYGFVTLGYNNIANMTPTVGIGTSLGGYNKSTAYWNNAIGFRLVVNSKGHTATGIANTIWGGGVTDADRPAFTVGIGDASALAGATYGNTNSRADGLVVRFNAEVVLPETTIAIIDNESTGKQVVTKEWHEDKQGTMYRGLLTQTGTSAPTDTVLVNSTGQTITWTRTDVGRYQFELSGDLTSTAFFTISQFANITNTFFRAGMLYDSKTDVTRFTVQTFSNLPNSLDYADALLTNFPVELCLY